jgi:hypothetical protein
MQTMLHRFDLIVNLSITVSHCIRHTPMEYIDERK